TASKAAARARRPHRARCRQRVDPHAGFLRHAAGRDRSRRATRRRGGAGSRGPFGGLVDPAAFGRLTPQFPVAVGRRRRLLVPPPRRVLPLALQCDRRSPPPWASSSSVWRSSALDVGTPPGPSGRSPVSSSTTSIAPDVTGSTVAVYPLNRPHAIASAIRGS